MTLFAAAILIATPAFQAEARDEARAIYDRMMDTLSGAASIEFRFRIDQESETVMDEEGSYVLAEGDRQRLQAWGKHRLGDREAGPPDPFEWISDGSRIQTRSGARKLDERDVRAGLNAFHIRRFGAGGLRAGLLDAIPDLIDPARDEFFGFATGPGEKVAGRRCRTISFVVRKQGPEEKALERHVKLWIDEATQLPAKRAIGPRPGSWSVVETYSAFKLNARVDPKRFAIPKK